MRPLNLAVFATKNIGLDNWDRSGLLHREMQMWEKLSNEGHNISFFSYHQTNLTSYYQEKFITKIYALTKTDNLFIRILITALRYQRILKSCDLFMTNQIMSGLLPLYLSVLFKKPLVVRLGYLHSEDLVLRGENKIDCINATHLEKKMFFKSAMIICTTERLKNLISKKYSINSQKINVIPNYVDTDLFKPIKDSRKKYDLIYIGREGKQKNLDLLLESINLLNNQSIKLKVLMIGNCNSSKNHDYVNSRKLKVFFLGNIPNHCLPKYINDSKIFVLPSLYEGHPKSLLEAMACGIPCIGNNVLGINEVISHMNNGLLFDGTKNDLASKIVMLLNDKKLSQSVGIRGNRYIKINNSIDRIASIWESRLSRFVRKI